MRRCSEHWRPHCFSQCNVKNNKSDKKAKLELNFIFTSICLEFWVGFCICLNIYAKTSSICADIRLYGLLFQSRQYLHCLLICISTKQTFSPEAEAYSWTLGLVEYSATIVGR